MAKIRLTKAMKDYIKEELMKPVTEWYNTESERIKQIQEEDLENLYKTSNEYINSLTGALASLGYEVKDMKTLESRLRNDIRYICNPRFVKIEEDKSLLKLREKFNAKKLEVDKALVQIELECALGTDKEEFMSLLNDYKEKVSQGL